MKRGPDGGVFEHPPSGFFKTAQKPRRAAPRFLAHLTPHLFRTLPENFDPGHLRSGHGIRSSDPTSEKVYARATATVVEQKLCYFQGLVYLLVPTICISRISAFISEISDSKRVGGPEALLAPSSKKLGGGDGSPPAPRFLRLWLWPW